MENFKEGEPVKGEAVMVKLQVVLSILGWDVGEERWIHHHELWYLYLFLKQKYEISMYMLN